MGKTDHARRLAAPVSSKDHVRGSPLAKVTLVGYGDFTCPDCAKSYRAVKKIQAEMGSRLRYVFRSFPQAPLDGKSQGAAEAAESAGDQGKFWEIHDRMFENQGASDQLQLAKHAKAVGLDARQFQQDMRGHVHLAKLRVVRQGGARSGVVQVPTFFINSLQHESAFGLATLLPAVQAAAGSPSSGKP
jgi:protein-disulfide isomerase